MTTRMCHVLRFEKIYQKTVNLCEMGRSYGLSTNEKVIPIWQGLVPAVTKQKNCKLEYWTRNSTENLLVNMWFQDIMKLMTWRMLTTDSILGVDHSLRLLLLHLLSICCLQPYEEFAAPLVSTECLCTLSLEKWIEEVAWHTIYTNR